MKSVGYKDFSADLYQSVDAQARETGVRVPADVMIELTRLCSIKCSHCYIGDARWVRDPNEMSTAQVKELLDVLAAKGTLWVCFTGGEALMRKDFRELWLYAKSRGFILTLFTNATLLNAAMADFLAEYPPFRIEVSIYGASEEIYERVSRVKGSHQRFLRGIENLRARPNLKWDLKTVVIRENAHELKAMESLAWEWGVEFKFDPVINPSIGQGKTGGQAPCATRLPEKEIVAHDFENEKRADDLRQLRAAATASEEQRHEHSRDDRLFGCSAGLNSVYLTSTGHMQMCVLTAHRGASVFSPELSVAQRFEKVWDSFGHSRAVKLRPDSPCRNCDLASICDNCPGFAFLENGDEHSAVAHLCRLTHLKAEKLRMPHRCAPNHFVHQPRPEEKASHARSQENEKPV